jgi:hypothetical protein
MTEDFVLTRDGSERNPEQGKHSAVDGLMVGRREVWVVVARPGQDPIDLLWSENSYADTLVPRVCRAVLDGGVLVIGDADPEDDPLLSELLHGEDSGSA